MRFTGTVLPLGSVDAASVTDWITQIPFSDWPQQADRPAMVNDPRWHHFQDMTDALVGTVLGWFPQGREAQRLLSVVLPGQDIPEHVDKVSRDWWGRVHVPLTSDPASQFLVGGEAHHLEPGRAYLVNITQPHGVIHAGISPRIHFMLDVGA